LLALRDAYRLMLREPAVKAAILSKVLGVAHLDLKVEPASESPADMQAADLVEYALEHCKGGVPQILWNILFPGAMDGFSVCEKIMRVQERGIWKGYHLLHQLKSRDTNNLRLLGDDFRNITAVQDRRTTQEYHPSNFVIYQHMALFESPTGMSDFRAAYKAFWMLDTVWQLRGMGLERYSLPVTKGTYSHPDQRADLESSLEDLRNQTWISLPVGCQVEALELSTRGQSDFAAAIQDLRTDIAIAISGAFLQMLEGQQAGVAADMEIDISSYATTAYC
jgi:hypothetical protein